VSDYDFDNMTPAEREAWFAERLQRQHDETVEREGSERLWIGLAIMALIVVAVLGLNAWLKTQGYGA
jgi:hypothetical protein